MKKFISLLLVFSIIVSFVCFDSVNVYAAQSNISMTYDEWINYIDDVENDPNLVSQVLRLLGFAVSDAKFLAKIPVATLKDLMGIPSDVSIKDWFKSKSSPSENNKPVLDDDLNDGLKAVETYYVENNPMYGYTFTLDEISSRISNAEVYTALKDVIPETSDVLGKIYFVHLAGLSTEVWSTDPPFRESEKLYMSIGGTGQGANYKYTSGYLYSLNYPDEFPTFTGMVYNSTTKSFDPANNPISSGRFYYLLNKPDRSVSVPTQTYYVVSRNARLSFRIFSTTPSVSDYMYQDYYYNTETWSNYQSSTGDYTLDESTTNTVTYGDIVSYIDSFNTTNGYPPSVDTIDKYIKQTDDDNKDDSGSGSGGDDSGDGNMSIFDFLSRIGAALGNLIKNLGNVLAELVEAVAEIISSLVESIPTVFGDFMDMIVGWLPAEIRALLTLGIVSMVLVGLIKLFRGS